MLRSEVESFLKQKGIEIKDGKVSKAAVHILLANEIKDSEKEEPKVKLDAFTKFLAGLEKFRKGDWKERITQVAKYCGSKKAIKMADLLNSFSELAGHTPRGIDFQYDEVLTACWGELFHKFDIRKGSENEKLLTESLGKFSTSGGWA